MEIIYKKIDELIPYVNNARTHSKEQVNQICASINEYGFTNPILIDEKGMIIAGHGRLMASKQLEMEEVPCIELKERLEGVANKVIINPLGEWTGGTDVDTGATNRKLGSDMAQSVTGGGLHGKDLSKADVSVNIYAFLKAQETGEVVELCCAIGDEFIDGKSYSEIVEIAREYINKIGGFEKFAEWGLY